MAEWYVEKFEELAKKWGASTAPWDQSEYISANMPNNLKNGVCQALVVMWMASKADWSVFTNIIKTPGGKAHVRGFMNLQHEGIRVDSLQGRKGVTEYFALQAEIFGVKYTKKQWKGNPVDAYKISAAVKSARNFYYYLNFYANTGGHSVGFVHLNDEIAFYDPNCGVASFPNGTGSTRFLDAFLKAVYSTYVEDFFVQQYLGKV
jgi:hypothetical protein